VKECEARQGALSLFLFSFDLVQWELIAPAGAGDLVERWEQTLASAPQ